MSHLNTLRKLINNTAKKLWSKLFSLKTLSLLCLTTLVAAIVWYYGPLLEYNGYALLAQKEKRVYIIICLYLAWLLELLIKDIDPPKPSNYLDGDVQSKLISCQNRFQGALKFLKKTTINKLGKQIHLSQLPWVLLVGPSNAGKTSLLNNSNIRFILQRQFKDSEKGVGANNHSDWWVTKDHTIIDLPGRYLLPLKAASKANPKAGSAPVLWHFFLKLIRKYRGRHGINGIMLALPVAELLKHPDNKAIDNTINYHIKRLKELSELFPEKVPVNIVLTKCDLFHGFKEYFAELGNDETTQAWGVSLSDIDEPNKTPKGFKLRFNALIKKLNEQLLARMHQERNSQARPNIKEFPLEIERSKDCLEEIIAKISKYCPDLKLNGIYLTSSQQYTPSNERALSHPQLVDAPEAPSRSYFIKQLLSIGLSNGKIGKITRPWTYRLAYLGSATVIALTAVMLGKDFERGLKNVYALQNQITDYQYTNKKFHNRDEKLQKTLELLNNLHQASKDTKFHLDINHLLSFYTFKSQKTAGQLYQKSVQTILIPQVKTYLEDYLKLPVNKSNHNLYAALKSYLMLGNYQEFDASYITKTMHHIMPKSINDKQADMLGVHLMSAFKNHHSNYPLNRNVIDKTRDYLKGNSELEIAQLILDSMGNNQQRNSTILARLNNSKTFKHSAKPISIQQMYTAKHFPKIMSQDIQIAAKEAVLGNWVIGETNANTNSQANIQSLHKTLQERYVLAYAQAWEEILDQIKLQPPRNLSQADAVINELTSSHSPLLQVLQTVRDNTFLKPIAEASPRLKNISLLLDKNEISEKQLYQIFTGLKSLHDYIKPVLHAKNPSKTAFSLIKKRMQHQSIDPITQLRLIADKSPDPIKQWLNQLANDSWRYLSKEASQYLNTAWQQEVLPAFNKKISKHYPFASDASKEVALKDFTAFFGNPGTLPDFYNHYLKGLVDESKKSWRWRKLGDNQLPFSNQTLRQVQHAMKIHRAFFPNGDKQLFVQFSLAPYQLGENFKKVSLNLGRKAVTDEKGAKTAHLFRWPYQNSQPSKVELFSDKNKPVTTSINGEWSWFKLVNQSFDSVISKKQIALNFSASDKPAKYYLYTKGKTNPFISLNMKHFKLKEKLT